MTKEIVLVTGASGFLGGRLTQILCEDPSLKVRVLTRSPLSASKFGNLDIETFRGALTDTDAIEKAMENVSYVFHCAAYAADWGPWKQFHESNVIGTENMVEAAAREFVVRNRKLKRFVYVSTTDVYGYPSDAPQCSESRAPVLTSLPYNRSKALAEQHVWRAMKAYFLPVTVIRASNIYGPGDMNFVKEIGDMILSGFVPLPTFGRAKTGFVYVDNLVKVMIAAARSSKTIGKAYNTHDDFNETLGEFTKMLATDLVSLNAQQRERQQHSTLTTHSVAEIKQPWIIPLPFWLVFLLAWLLETVYSLLSVSSRPFLTRHAVLIIGTDQNFNTHSLSRDLLSETHIGKVPLREGVAKSVVWFHDAFVPRIAAQNASSH